MLVGFRTSAVCARRAMLIPVSVLERSFVSGDRPSNDQRSKGTRRRDNSSPKARRSDRSNEPTIVFGSNTTEEEKQFFPAPEEYQMRRMKPGTVRASDLKTGVTQDMSPENQQLLVDVEIPAYPANALLKADARLFSEAVTARRVNKATKGGRTEKFSVLVVVGDYNGLVGVGSSKGISYMDARSRAVRRAMRGMFYVDRLDDRTLFHQLEAKHKASKVIMMPAPQRSGIRANKTAGAFCRMVGIKDIFVKTHGTPNPWAILACIQKALQQHSTPEEVALKRGMRVHDVSERMYM